MRFKNPSASFFVSVGGATVKSEVFSKIAADKVKRERFAESALNICRNNSLQGFDLDWVCLLYFNTFNLYFLAHFKFIQEHPETPADKDNFVLLCKEVINALHSDF